MFVAMVFEGRIAEMLQNQASRFLRGFSSDQLRLGLLSGRLELHSLALNTEPMDALLLESEIPLVVKAGSLLSAAVEISLMQGELELIVDGIVLLLAPACQWLTRDEVYAHRVSEIQRLEFVHMRSQVQRRTLERDMFKQLFADYLSRLKITIRNVHIRVEVDREADPSNFGRPCAFGIALASCAVTPVKIDIKAPAKDKDSTAGELLLAERVSINALSLYHEAPGEAKEHVSREVYETSKAHSLGVFGHIKQDRFLCLMAESRRGHAATPPCDQLMVPTSCSVSVDLRSQAVREGFQLDGCLHMEISVKLEGGPSRLHFNRSILDTGEWFVRRTLDFQIWQFMHPTLERPTDARARWRALWSFTALQRRVHNNQYSAHDAIQMRLDCKEYIKLYKRKFNGPSSLVSWRRSLSSLSASGASRLVEIELTYPPDKVVNFRLMAHAELKTEMALNSFINTDDGGQEASPYRRTARELTPLEQLHLHGQHGYGVNIYRGLPPPPSSLKIRIEIQSSQGLWWVCKLGGATAPAPKAKSSSTQHTKGQVEGDCEWAFAVDCVAQPIRVLLVDSTTDASVFLTLEVPACTSSNERPLALLLARTSLAFAGGSPGRGGQQARHASSGGKGPAEWCSVLELDGTVYWCSQLKTVLASSANCPWDIYAHFSCGEAGDLPVPRDGLAWGGQAAAGSGSDASARVRVWLPLAMPSGQPGPLAELLGRSVGAARKPGSQEIRTGPSHSAVSWLARHVCITRGIAMLRLHLRLPPTQVQGDGAAVTLPRLDAAAHLEHGGLVDGFVVGLHHLQYFFSSLVSPSTLGPAPPSPTEGHRWSGGSRRGATGSAPWPLEHLAQAPPLALVLSGLLAAISVAIGARAPAAKRSAGEAGAGGEATTEAEATATLHGLLRKVGLAGALGEGSPVAEESPAAVVSLLLTAAAVITGRRVLWDLRDGAVPARRDDAAASEASLAQSAVAAGAVGEVHGLFASALQAVLMIGFPLHPRCLELAAWAGAQEILAAVVAARPKGLEWPPHNLLSLAARGALVNLPERQERLVRWLLRQGAKVDECDKSGRTLLDWASWAGDVGLINLGLRAGLLPSAPRSAAAAAARLRAASKGDRQAAPMMASPFEVSSTLASPLAYAVAGRSLRAVALLLRAGGDPHTPPRGVGIGPMLLAVRNCEFELACELLRGAPHLCVAAALGPALPSSVVLSGAAAKGDSSDGPGASESSMRATIVLAEALRRFSSLVARHSAEESMQANQRAMLTLGAHPDENLFAVGQLPFGDIAHPLLGQLPPPAHRVAYDLRPYSPPHSWFWRQGGGSANIWAPATRFVQYCLGSGFRPDGAVISRALPALPSEARRLVQQLFCEVVDFTSLNGDAHLAGRAQPMLIGLDDPYNGSSPKPSRGVPTLNLQDAARAPPSRDEGGPTKGTWIEVASSSAPSLWLAVSCVGAAPVGPPLHLDALRVCGARIEWVRRDTAPLSESLSLRDVAALRRFELSAGAAGGGCNVVEIRLAPQVNASDIVPGTSVSRSGAVTLNGEPAYMNGTSRNGHAEVNGMSHALSFNFARDDQADTFAAMVHTSLRSVDSNLGESARQGDSIDKTAIRPAGGPWDPVALREVLSAKTVAPSALPAVRVVVLGAPRVGKTSVAKRLQAGLKSSVERGSDHGWIQVASGNWPDKGKDRAEVYIWDGAAAPLPGLVSRLVADSAAPLLVVMVVDASLQHIGAPADAFVAACTAEIEAPACGSRRILIVENTFHETRGAGASADGSGKAPGRSRCHVARVNVASAESCDALMKSFAAALGEVVSELETRLGGRAASLPIPAPLSGAAPPPWHAVLAARQLPTSRGAALDPRGDRALAARVAGDSALLEPAALSWAWAAVRAAQGSLGGDARGCAAVVQRERLEETLRVAEGGAQVLLRMLADAGLLCPVPCFADAARDANTTSTSSSLCCRHVLVPDFAARMELTPATARRLLGVVAPSGEEPARGASAGDGADKASNVGVDTKTQVSARLLWDASACAAPQLRTVLRNFIASGAEGACSAKPRAIDIKEFVLLEAGPSGSPGPSSLDSLSPGFLLVFGLPVAPEAPASGAAQPPDSGRAAVRPLPSIERSTPSGGPTIGVRSRGYEATPSTTASSMEDEGLAPLLASGLTAVVVGVSSSGSRSGARGDIAPYWDVFCAGPHAQWAWRALLGNGTAAGLSFEGFRKASAPPATPSATSGAGQPRWPLPPPTCVLTTSSQQTCYQEKPTQAELASFSWLFNGPQAANARSALLSSSSAAVPVNGFAAWCSRLSGKSAAGHGDAPTGGFGDCAAESFDELLLARAWHAMPRLLDGALAAGCEAWALCAAALARAAHDAAGAAAGARGCALPLLGRGSGPGVNQLFLVPEGPGPLTLGAGPEVSHEAGLGAIGRLGGVQAWLRLCRPAALWSTAGKARGYLASGARGTAEGDDSPQGSQIVEALQAAFTVHLTEQMVAEVWEALSAVEATSLVRRPAGTWTTVGDKGFLL